MFTVETKAGARGHVYRRKKQALVDMFTLETKAIHLQQALGGHVYRINKTKNKPRNFDLN